MRGAARRAARVLVALAFALAAVLWSDVASYADTATIGAANTTADSYYGAGAWAGGYWLGGASTAGTIQLPEPKYGDGTTSRDLCVELFARDWPRPDQPPSSAYDWVGKRCGTMPASDIHVATGVDYYYVMESYAADGEGRTFDSGDMAGALAAVTPDPTPPPPSCTPDNGFGCGTESAPMIVTSDSKLTIFMTMAAGLCVLLLTIQTVKSFGDGFHG